MHTVVMLLQRNPIYNFNFLIFYNTEYTYSIHVKHNKMLLIIIPNV